MRFTGTPLGTEVTLADGRTGVVADVSLEAPLAPTVRVREGDAIAEIAGAELAAPVSAGELA